ncbi:ArsR/SmtB family transcription factor [Rhizohabitans arisaemae]|uniref:ArsR/SmtB family transcription factor n=1 Tax=Rhizohabitans arisaemae TaxID=2720610 RepID=UPI0024B23B81|nr:winged helix-turn-helix domain-containing protein [Rhizohabitans arisaemae]
MGLWHVGVETLVRSRFAVSALTETVAALIKLHHGDPGAGGRGWFQAHAPAYRRMLAADPFAARFVATALGRWLPDFMVTPPEDDDRGFHDELRRVRRTPPGVAVAHLATAAGGEVPAELRGPDLPDRVADLLDWIWTNTLDADWPRRKRILEADIVARTERLSSGGWAAVIEDMRPGLRWLGDGSLRINANDYPPRDIAEGAQLLFIPATTVRYGWVAWEEPHRYALIYPCSGILADAVDHTPPQALSRLIGPVRAHILTLLGSPKSTTQLVALTGYGLGSVGGHLRVLLDAGLLRRSRSGRSVLYYRTPSGDLLAEIASGTG